MKGIGYCSARTKRLSEGFTGTNVEAAGNEEFLLYFGRAYISDFETGLTARGLLKIGRGKFKTAIQRGRNQPGVDFRIFAEILVLTNDDTHVIEGIVKHILSSRNVLGSQGQRELYNINDDELVDIVNDIAEIAIDCHNVGIKCVNFYDNDAIINSYTY